MSTSKAWRPPADLSFETNALEAIYENAENLVLVAGPGTGKTEVLAQRADYLFTTSGCMYPRRILAISFKVDAASNLASRVRERCGYRLAARFDSSTFDAFAKRMIDRFRPILTGIDELSSNYSMGAVRIQESQITFSDLVPLAIKIISSCEAARFALRQTYSHVLLDEFQDCTAGQYEMIRHAFQGSATRITAVGDTKQSIMRWAGALDGILETFSVEFSARALNLYQNFRSAPKLRRMQNSMILAMDPSAAVPSSEITGDGGQAVVLNFVDNIQEAGAIVWLIREWIWNGTPASEIAVLFSKQINLYGECLLEALSAAGVPHRQEQALQDLMVEPLAMVALDLLRVVTGVRQAEAYARLLDLTVQWALDDEEVEHRERRKLETTIRSLQARLDAHESSAESSSVDHVMALVEEFFVALGDERVVTLSLDYERSDRVAAVLSKLRDALSSHLASGHDLVTTLESLTVDSSVRILTFHKSKGLEFDSVIIVGVEEETFWSPNPDDDRAAFFVGISRAKNRLVLTTAGTRFRPEGFSGRWNESRRPHEEFLSYCPEC